MSKVSATSKVNDAIYPLVEYKLFFVQLDENYRTVLIARFSLSQDDITEMRVFMDDFFDFVT